jgi:hypothetical protein
LRIHPLPQWPFDPIEFEPPVAFRIDMGVMLFLESIRLVSYLQTDSSSEVNQVQTEFWQQASCA